MLSHDRLLAGAGMALDVRPVHVAGSFIGKETLEMAFREASLTDSSIRENTMLGDAWSQHRRGDRGGSVVPEVADAHHARRSPKTYVTVSPFLAYSKRVAVYWFVPVGQPVPPPPTSRASTPPSAVVPTVPLAMPASYSPPLLGGGSVTIRVTFPAAL